MREILFRGKRKDNGDRIVGQLLRYEDGRARIIESQTDIFCYEKDNSIIQTVAHEVYPDTVGQFTGRTDKNGKKVFEHDILQTFTIWADGTVEKCGVGIVQWWENDQCYVLTTKEGYHIEDFGNLGRPEYYEVIGNIHDNPELIGERKVNERT